MTGERRAVAVSAGGWIVVALAVLGIGFGIAFGWLELLVIGAACAVLAVVSALFLFGRASGRIGIEVLEGFVVAGASATVAVQVHNDTARRLPARAAELAVGERVEHIVLPPVAPGETRQVVIAVPTERRGVIRLGPVTVLRRDPIGLARRESVRSDAAELFVHPHSVPLELRSTGLLRDLEGIPTADLTDSDMSFHALRGYLPGDDRRHIHWKSTAKTGDFLVRQFEQTRRSHLIVMQSLAAADYASDDEFELSVSVTASIGVSAIRSGMSVSVYAGSHDSGRRAGSARARGPRAEGLLRSRAPRELLDDLSLVRESGSAPRLPALARAVGDAAPDASVVFLACGSAVTARQLRAAAAHFPAGVEVIAVLAEPEGESALVRIDALRISRIGYLDDLVRTLVRAVGT
ncbi:DUF58 domain-containing protein [Herbiconiux sp. YIM B11900]|uniref:DUF58 domain-containing protein n=1 Tax=Herbiconiux sp. YIM B11900 TaxID=3404131 RepID=UPI003F8740D4